MSTPKYDKLLNEQVFKLAYKKIMHYFPENNNEFF